MKIRNGFVSNSSSSSYLIGFDYGLNLNNLFVPGDFGGDSTDVQAVGVDEVIDHFKEWYDLDSTYKWGTEEEMANEYRMQFSRFAALASKVAKVVDSGKNVAIISVSYGDDASYNNLRDKSIDIIEDFG